MQDPLGASAPKQRSLPRLLLLLILSLSAFIQFTVVSRTTVIFPFGADAADYFSYAYNLHKHSTYSIEPTWSTDARPYPPKRDSVRPPGYPLFLAMLGVPEASRAFERKVVYLQAGFGVLSVLLVYLVSSSFSSRPAALFVALVVAINPHFATISTYLLTESLFLALLLASTMILIKATEVNRRSLFAIAGILWGTCALVRPTVEFLPVILLIGVLAIPRLRMFIPQALLAFACFAAILAPWIFRNQASDLKPSSSVLAVNTLIHGSYPDFKYRDKKESFGFPYRFDPNLADISRDVPTAIRHIGAQFKRDPATYAKWYLLGKPIAFLSWGNIQGFDILIAPVNYTPYYQDIRFAVLREVSYWLHWPAMILGLIGIVLLSVRPGLLGLSAAARSSAQLVALIAVYAILFHMIAAPFPRYGIPFRPLFYVLAMLPFRALWLKLKHRIATNEKADFV